MDNGIFVDGAKVDKDGLVAITDAICRILQQDVEQKTKRAALQTLERMVPSMNVTVSGCRIDGSTHVHAPLEEKCAPEPGGDGFEFGETG